MIEIKREEIKFQINVVRTTFNTRGKSLLIMQIYVFLTKFQHAYFRMYSNNNFFVNGMMETNRLITVSQKKKKQIDN